MGYIHFNTNKYDGYSAYQEDLGDILTMIQGHSALQGSFMAGEQGELTPELQASPARLLNYRLRQLVRTGAEFRQSIVESGNRVNEAKRDRASYAFNSGLEDEAAVQAFEEGYAQQFQQMDASMDQKAEQLRQALQDLREDAQNAIRSGKGTEEELRNYNHALWMADMVEDTLQAAEDTARRYEEDKDARPDYGKENMLDALIEREERAYQNEKEQFDAEMQRLEAETESREKELAELNVEREKHGLRPLEGSRKTWQEMVSQEYDGLVKHQEELEQAVASKNREQEEAEALQRELEQQEQESYDRMRQVLDVKSGGLSREETDDLIHDKVSMSSKDIRKQMEELDKYREIAGQEIQAESGKEESDLKVLTGLQGQLQNYTMEKNLLEEALKAKEIGKKLQEASERADRLNDEYFGMKVELEGKEKLDLSAKTAEFVKKDVPSREELQSRKVHFSFKEDELNDNKEKYQREIRAALGKNMKNLEERTGKLIDRSEKQLEDFKKRLDDVKAVFRDSDEFKAMRDGLRNLDLSSMKNQKDKKGRIDVHVMKEQFDALKKACDHYMKEKKDKNRTFEKGRKRYDLAADLSAYMQYMSKQMENVESERKVLDEKTKIYQKKMGNMTSFTDLNNMELENDGNSMTRSRQASLSQPQKEQPSKKQSGLSAGI